MKPDWDKLMKEFKNDETRLVADVDCTAKGQPLCETHGIRGYPTIKYGDPSALEDYQGGRSFSDLQKFAKELKPSCSPYNMSVCSDEDKQKIEELQAMSTSDLADKIKEQEKKITEAEAHFKAEVDKLQKQYTELNTSKDAKIKEVKDSGLALMKSVQAAGAKKDKKDDEL